MSVNYSVIERSADTNAFTAPPLLPNAAYYIRQYGYIIHPGEQIRLDGFAERINDQIDSFRAAVEAGEIRRWFALMLYAEDSITNFDTLPCQFEWEGEVFNAGEVRTILGVAAVNWLIAESSSAA